MKNFIIASIILIFSFKIHASIISSTFSVDQDGWGTQGKWNTATNSGGIAFDNPYLLVDAEAEAPKRGVIIFNTDNTWTGNLSTKGATAIEIDLKNMSTDPLRMRIAFGDLLNPMGGTWFVSKSYVEVLPSSDWSSITLPILIDDMEKANSAQMGGSSGPLSYSEVFENVYALRIISQGANKNATVEDFYGDVYFDNISMIPEPSTVALIGFTSTTLLLLRTKKRFKKNNSGLQNYISFEKNTDIKDLFK